MPISFPRTGRLLLTEPCASLVIQRPASERAGSTTLHPTVPLLTLIGFGDEGWGPRFLAGAVLTVEISVCGYAVGIVLGLLGVWAKLSRNVFARGVGGLYTTLIRAVPELLLIILIYYTFSAALENLVNGTGLVEDFAVDPFAAAVVTLGFVQGAYLTEVFRGAILSVPRGVSEAGRALALKPFQRFRLLILPLALRHALPGMSNLWLAILKDSSLISVVGFEELLFTGKQAAGGTKLYFFFYLFTAALFLALTAVSIVLLGFLTRATERGHARA